METNIQNEMIYAENEQKSHILQEIEVIYKPKKKLKQSPQIRYSKDAYNYIRTLFAPFLFHHEEVWIILLNPGKRIIGCTQVAKGGIDYSLVDIRIIFQTLLVTHATSFILVHNHPEGELKPSEVDKLLTKKVLKGGNFLGIRLLDHLIIADEKFYSFADEGML